MKLKVIKALWGMTGSLEQQVEQIAAAGYDGIECGLPSEAEEEKFRELLRTHKLDYVAMIFTGGDDHLASFKSQAERAAGFRPLSITSHSLKDSVPVDAQIAFFREAAAFERELGVPVGHETHRGRALFNPWDTARILEAVPDVRLTADFSHWCNVTESTLEDYERFLEPAFSRVVHIHGRVGYAQGPQVTDPRAPEFAHEVSRHFGWWERMAQARRASGAPFVTFTPEFGPPGYLHTLPYTGQPVADLWDVCLWTAEAFRERFKRTFSS